MGFTSQSKLNPGPREEGPGDASNTEALDEGDSVLSPPRFASMLAAIRERIRLLHLPNGSVYEVRGRA